MNAHPTGFADNHGNCAAGQLARGHQRYLDEGAFPSGVAGLGYGGRFRKG